LILASSIALLIALAAPSPVGSGEVIWYASEVAPYPIISA